MNSADCTVSSDWDIIENEILQLVDEMNSEETVPQDLKEKVQKGSCVDDIPQHEDPCMPAITVSEVNNHHENSSSSEFDVLDESAEDNQGNLSFSNMEYSMSSSLGESNLPAEAEIETDAEARSSYTHRSSSTHLRSQEHNVNAHPYLLAIAVALACVALLVASIPLGSLRLMKQRMSALQNENDELKNMMQSKIESDRLLIALEDQIKSLKDENFKLSQSMRALVAQLEEQTAILRKDKETKVLDPYRSEIEKLKEQINILQIDNEELQKQLVRTRYGIYSPHPKEQKADQSVEEKEEKTDGKDNSSDILVEEINELRQKLYIEVEKLKNWKDSVQHLVKTLGNGYAGSSEGNEKLDLKDQESFVHSRPSSEKERMKKPKSGKRDQKLSDWSWVGVKKNLKDTFEGLQDIDVPNIISNYVDKKKIEGVFESVGHYFRKAQDKTKKVLNFNNDINQEMWQFFGQLRNQWNDISNKYYQKYYSTKQKAEDCKSQFHKNKQDAQDVEADKRSVRYQKQNEPEETSNDRHDPNLYSDVESSTTSTTRETPENEMAPEDNSWVFKRAAHRSQLREEEQEAFTNWFLKRGRDFHYNEDESLKEWFKETYQKGNSDGN